MGRSNDPESNRSCFADRRGAGVCTGSKAKLCEVTKADAQKVVKIISGDRAKTQTYCDMAKLFNQIERAGEKDIKKSAELHRKLDELAKRLGPEYVTLVSGIPNVNPNSQEGQEIRATLAARTS